MTVIILFFTLTSAFSIYTRSSISFFIPLLLTENMFLPFSLRMRDMTLHVPGISLTSTPEIVKRPTMEAERIRKRMDRREKDK